MAVKLTIAGVIKQRGDTQKEVAEFLGVSMATLSMKVNGKAEFWPSEIKKLSERYQLTADEVWEIFFQ